MQMYCDFYKQSIYLKDNKDGVNLKPFMSSTLVLWFEPKPDEQN